ncbi:MAG: hypothetical protein FWD11_04500 [Micrococcales bacterium]|nr:hypothetical protein [Micrococcales bacterium]
MSDEQFSPWTAVDPSMRQAFVDATRTDAADEAATLDAVDLVGHDEHDEGAEHHKDDGHDPGSGASAQADV